ncbi:translation machinery-associated protein 16-like isoform X2 [Argiope bruennichi]|nr:translation machinery-associated protein 16-like isoform X2 [Argiope bruennichi]
MPKVKKNSSVIHPNSRKAMQMARLEHRGLRLEKRREESNTKLQAKLNKLKWFRDNIDTSKTLYNSEEVHELIMRYLQRFSDEEKRIKEMQCIKGRHNQNRMSVEYKMQFTIEQEKRDYETCGLEIPYLTKAESFEYFKGWDKDARFLPAIDLVVCKSPKK